MDLGSPAQGGTLGQLGHQPMKAVGRFSRGRDMPNMTPKAEMAAETSIPPATSRWGMRMAHTEPIRLPSRAVRPMGTAM